MIYNLGIIEVDIKKKYFSILKTNAIFFSCIDIRLTQNQSLWGVPVVYMLDCCSVVSEFKL